jgi:tetratricopeptide (TPR) repeat protein
MNQKQGNINSASKDNKPSGNATGDAFGAFQNASSAKSVPSVGVGASNNGFMGSNTSSKSNIDDFGMFNNSFPTQKQQAPVQPSVGDPLDMFFTPSSGNATTVSGGSGGQPLSEVDDWGLDSGLGGGGVNDSHGVTTELEGLPAPPAGVTASAAKNKGIENQKQGQYADAIKWLSWAVVLLEKTGDKASTMEVLSTRASCYKEVGEYKKAVADCSKV